MPVYPYIQRPLIPLAITAFGGCLFGQYLSEVSSWIWFGLALLAALAARWRHYTSQAFPLLLGAGFCLYAGLAIQAGYISPDDISRWVPRRDIVLQGRLCGMTQPARTGRYWTGVLVCDEARWQGQKYHISGRVRFSMPGQAKAWNPGDRIRVRGWLQGVDAPLNPGEFDYAAFLARYGIRARLKGMQSGDAVRARPAGMFSPGWTAGKLHRVLVEGIRRSIPPDARGLVRALVAGDRSGLSGLEREHMAASGLAHVLAISGLHVGIVFGALCGLLRVFRAPKKISLIAGVIGIALLALATGGKAPVIRAVVMIACMVLSGLADRRGDPGSGLALAGLVLLANNPMACQDAGFQLSFSATASILAILPLIQQTEKMPQLIRWPLSSIIISGAAGLGTAPLTIYHFYSLVPVSLLANLIAIPLLSAAVVNGLLAALLAWIWPGGAEAAGWLAGWAVRGLTGAAQIAGGLPGGRIFLWPGAGWWTLCLYIAAALFTRNLYQIIFLKKVPGDSPASPRNDKFTKINLKKYCGISYSVAGLRFMGGFLLIMILIMVYPLFRPPGPRPGETRVTFLSLGIGESALIENGQGARILIDTGTEQEFLWRVKPYLAGRGINRLDALLLSHTDADHAGGAVAALDFFSIPKLISAGLGFSARPQVKAIEQAIRRRKVSHLILRRGECLKIFPGMEMESIWPPRGGRAGDNKHCLVVWIKSPAGRLLFTGDSPDKIEAQWCLDKTCDLLKAGHHGAQDSSSCGLLAQVQPRVAVVTPGNRNPFGLPDQETLARLKDFSGIVLNTKSRGAVEVTLQPGNISWQTWK